MLFRKTTPENFRLCLKSLMVVEVMGKRVAASREPNVLRALDVSTFIANAMSPALFGTVCLLSVDGSMKAMMRMGVKQLVALLHALMVVEVMGKCVTTWRESSVLRALSASMASACALSPALLWTVSLLTTVNGSIQPGMSMGVNQLVALFHVKSLMVVTVMGKCVAALAQSVVLRALDVSMIQVIHVMDLIVLVFANAMSPALLWTVSLLTSSVNGAIQPGMRMAAKAVVEHCAVWTIKMSRSKVQTSTELHPWCSRIGVE